MQYTFVELKVHVSFFCFGFETGLTMCLRLVLNLCPPSFVLLLLLLSVIVCHNAWINVDKLLLLIILNIERLLWGKLKCSSVEKCPGLMQ